MSAGERVGGGGACKIKINVMSLSLFQNNTIHKSKKESGNLFLVEDGKLFPCKKLKKYLLNRKKKAGEGRRNLLSGQTELKLFLWNYS